MADVIHLSDRRAPDLVLACHCGCEAIIARQRGTGKARLHCMRCGDDLTQGLLR